MKSDAPIYGLLAEFAGPEQLVAAARAAHQDGYRKMPCNTGSPCRPIRRTSVAGPSIVGPHLFQSPSS